MLAIENNNPDKIWKNNKSKEFYLNRKVEQLQQWERVIEKIISRAENANGENKSKIHQHLNNIQTQKSRIERIVEHLQNAENEKWDSSKINLEKKWVILRESFLNASQSMSKFLK